MKLAYILTSRYPTEKAYGYQISKMCEAFVASGVEVELIAPARKNEIKESCFEFYDIKNNFSVKYIKSPDLLSYKLGNAKIKFYFQFALYLVCLFFVKPNKDSFIYSRSPEVVWIFGKKGYKTIYESHDWFAKNKNISLWFLKKSNKIVTTNSFIKNEFVKHGFDEKKILVAPHGVDLNIFDIDISKDEALNKIGLEKLKDKKFLVYTGSFTTMNEDKGIEDTLKALKILNDKNIIFVAVGGNEKDIEKYNLLAKELGIEHGIFLEGRKSQKELAIYQKVADILLMPFPDKAHYRQNMTPLKMFEYMASKRPILASNLPSIKQILNEEIAFFCEPDNSKDLSIKILDILSNSKEIKIKNLNAFEFVKRYTWENRVIKILDFIKK